MINVTFDDPYLQKIYDDGLLSLDDPLIPLVEGIPELQKELTSLRKAVTSLQRQVNKKQRMLERQKAYKESMYRTLCRVLSENAALNRENDELKDENAAIPRLSAALRQLYKERQTSVHKSRQSQPRVYADGREVEYAAAFRYNETPDKKTLTIRAYDLDTPDLLDALRKCTVISFRGLSYHVRYTGGFISRNFTCYKEYTFTFDVSEVSEDVSDVMISIDATKLAEAINSRGRTFTDGQAELKRENIALGRENYSLRRDNEVLMCGKSDDEGSWTCPECGFSNPASEEYCVNCDCGWR